MHGEHDVLPVIAGNGDSSLFVAATLAALVLAGSALVYCKACDQQPERTQPSEHSTPDNMDPEKHQSLDVHSYAHVSSSTHDSDSKESKSSRSKDRRRRGKDPLKEFLKGGKKVKTANTTPIKQLFNSKPIIVGLDNHHNININDTSTPTSNSSPNNAFSRASGKHSQQEVLPAPSVGTTPSVHSRSTSEVSQSNTGRSQPHPHQNTRDSTTFTSKVFDDHVLTPSASSSHNDTEGNTSISEEREPEIHLAVPSPSVFSTIQNNDFSEILHNSVPYSSSPSSATNTTTASCVITPATSPSLSYTSSKLVPASSGDSSELANNGSGSDCGPKNNTLSHALDTDTKSRNISRKQQPLPNQSPSKSKTTRNPGEWDNKGETAVLPSSSVIASDPLSTLITVPEFPPDIVYRKPPRLQSKSLWLNDTKNDASSSIPGSVSHPSLLSPISGCFVSPDSALLSPSISSNLEKVPRRVSKAAKEGESEAVEERDSTEDNYIQLEFPTLNPTVATSTTSGPTAGSSAGGPSNNHRPTTPRRAQSSRRPSTPSGSTPPPHPNSGSVQPPAVSTQTQLASLRGALEAARLREEKHKAEMERYAKELEALRWDKRRGEVELQNRIRHLMHQLQMYTSLFASISPPPTSQQQTLQQSQGPMTGNAGLSNPGDRATSSPGSSNGPTITSSPGPQSLPAAVVPGPPVSSPAMHLHMLPPLQLNELSSPVSPSGIFPAPMSSMHPPSSYFPYLMPTPPLHPHAVMPLPIFTQRFHNMQQQFLQFQQYQQHQPHQSNSPTIQTQQANSISMLHPPSISSYQSYSASSSSSMPSGSRSSSRPGTESAGSSPDLNGSPSPVSGAKRRKRSRTRSSNGYIGGRSGWNDTSDGWILGSVGIDEGDEHESIQEYEAQANNGDDNEGEGVFNELLADAILKRPGSIGVRSGKRSVQALLEEKDMEQLENDVLDAVEPLTEFKFPSLSDSGNVCNQSSSSSSPVVVSPLHQDLESNIFDLQAQAVQSIVHVEAAVSQNGVEPDNRHKDQS